MPFVVEFLVLAPLVLADTPSDSVGGVVFLLPWFLVLFGLINLPFAAAAFRAFDLDPATRRNHALEHATIHYLEADGARRLSGRAARDGFRVCGRSSVREIRTAFEQVRRVVHDGGPLPHISRRCGSNVVSSLGLALLLLLTVALVSLGSAAAGSPGVSACRRRCLLRRDEARNRQLDSGPILHDARFRGRLIAGRP